MGVDFDHSGIGAGRRNRVLAGTADLPGGVAGSRIQVFLRAMN
jgi:hypothetical protein